MASFFQTTQQQLMSAVHNGDKRPLIDQIKSLWRPAIAEFVAMAIFTYISCGSVVASTTLTSQSGDAISRLLFIAFAHGIGILITVASVAGVSGGHVNPAVSLALGLAGRVSPIRVFVYWVAQFAGAIVGAGLLAAATPEKFRGGLGGHSLGPHLDSHPGLGLLMETILTFILVFVIFGTAVDTRGLGHIAPLVIGLAVFADHLVGLPYTGSSLNPARSLGPAVITGDFAGNFWIYFLGPFLGASIASVLYRFALMGEDVIPRLTTQSDAIAVKV